MNNKDVKDQIDSALGGMTEQELRQLAADYVEQRIFTSNMVDQDMLFSVFMILLLGGKSLAGFAQDAAIFYEYYDKAMPVSVNGYPTFLSVRKVIHKDLPALNHYIDEYRQMKAKFFTAPTPAEIEPNEN